MTSERRYVGTPEAARRVGVERTTLYRAYRSGRVQPAQITPGGKVRWDVDDLRTQLGLQPEDPMTAVLTRTTDPVVAVIVTSRQGVLLTRRNDGVPPIGFVSGEVEDNETPGDAAAREVLEETGLTVRAGHMLGDRVHPNTGRTMIYMAAVPTENLTIAVRDPEELAAVFWCPTWRGLVEEIPEDRLFGPVAQHLRLMLPAT